jgi:hypothetical protein
MATIRGIVDRLAGLLYAMIPQEGPTLVPYMGEEPPTHYIFRSDQALGRMQPKHRSIGIHLENSLLTMVHLGVESATGFPEVGAAVPEDYMGLVHFATFSIYYGMEYTRTRGNGNHPWNT